MRQYFGNEVFTLYHEYVDVHFTGVNVQMMNWSLNSRV